VSFKGAEMRLINTFPKLRQQNIQLDLSQPQSCILETIHQTCEKFDADIIVASEQEADYALSYAYINPFIAIAIKRPALEAVNLVTLPARSHVWVYVDAAHPAYAGLKNRYRMLNSEYEFDHEIEQLGRCLFQLPQT